jgi:peptidoglycan/xylan/chitin deacetylase (PgdA/CDA1 family)
VRRAADAVLAPVPLGVWEQLFPKDVVSLCYHVVSDVDLPHLKLYRWKNSAQFEADLRFAKPRCLSVEELRAVRLGRARGAPNRILLTFDDGLIQCYDTIRPLLLKYAIDAAFFVSTGFLDDAEVFRETAISLCIDALERADEALCAALAQALFRERPLRNEPVAQRRLRDVRVRSPLSGSQRRLVLWLLDLDSSEAREREMLCLRLGIDPQAYVRRHPVFMTTDQVRGLTADGFTVGAHGLRHTSLESLPNEAVMREIVASCNAVREITGQERVPFAFPHSGLTIDRGLLASIKREHPFIDLFFDSGYLRAEPPIVVNRIFADDPHGQTGTSLPRELVQAWSQPAAWHTPYRRGR